MPVSRKNTKAKQRERNIWKWAFAAVIIILIGGGIYLYTQVTAPVEKQTASQPIKESNSSFEVDLNSQQVNALADNYLARLQKGKKTKYGFMVGKKYATVTGSTKFLGTKINFALNFTPIRQANGNVLLKAKGLAVGRLNLPITYVMGYIKNKYKLPTWVELNQKKKTILLDLNQYSRHHNLQYSAKKISLKNGDFRFLVTVPKN